MPVALVPVTRTIWENCIALRVRPDQKGFVASNLYSLAEAKVTPTLNPMAIYHDDLMVGFCMYGVDPDDGNQWIHRLMIDARHQGKGYGRAAMVEVICRLGEAGTCREVLTSFEPENCAAEKLYGSLGFQRTGKVIGGEIVVCLDLEQSCHTLAGKTEALVQHAVVISDYYPGWPLVFDSLAGRVGRNLGPVATAIEHVGSTSVPGCAAKPIIDVDVVVAPGDVSRAIELLANMGYVHTGDQGVPGRQVMKPPNHGPNHHLYVCPSDSPELARHLAFRDYLRAHPEEVRAYSTLKKELARRLGSDRLTYTESKGAFIARILDLAGAEMKGQETPG